MMDNGLWDLNMVLEFGKVYKEIHILVNGLMVNLKDMEFTYGQMVINTKVNGTII